MDQRHANERAFFKTSPWNELAKDRTGITSLKKFLGKLLYNHIRGEFPALVNEIRTHVEESRNALEALGPARQTCIEQRQFITRLAAKYQSTARNSLSGNYESTLESRHPLKLRMHLQNANESFGSSVEKFGHTRAFRLVDGNLDEAYHCSNSEDNIYDWIRELYRESRGPELPGTVNPAVLENLFRQQSAQWEPLAKAHVVKVERLINDFNGALLENLIPEDSLRVKVAARNLVASSSTHVAATTELDRILLDERGGILQTINHYFAETLSRTREDRVLARLKGVGLEDGLMQHIDIAKIARAAHLSNEEQAVNDIHDILKAYYNVAMKRFTDNVIVQVVERLYLGSDGPVKHISPELVGSLSDTELQDIAAESYTTAATRNDISYRLGRLETALNLAESQSF